MFGASVIKLPSMLTKIYLALLASSVAIVGFVAWYAWSWLASIGLPAAAYDGYLYNADAAFKFLLVSWIVLAIMSTAIAWRTGKAWPLWTSFLYFAVFALAIYFWLERSAFQFQKAAGLTDAKLTFSPIKGVLIIIGIGLITFCTHFMVAQLRQRLSLTEAPVMLDGDDNAT